ncbi:MAG: type secretion system baseplate subunit TssG [Pseudomonadota bacterium]|jgi:type VI secretion system protein ImpH
MNVRESRLPLPERLLNTPQGFDLFQAISLLEREGVAEGRVEIGASGGPEAVRLKSHISLGFEASDVRNISRGAETGEAFTLSTPVLSLSGHGGPLPAAFTELLLERNAAKDFATSDFLDIIQHRMLSLFYLNRKRRRLGLGWASPQASTVARSTGYLCGLEVDSVDRQTHKPWLRHAGLIAGAPRSMTALCALLADRYAILFQGEQFVGGWQRLEEDELTQLGHPQQSPQLGRNAFLGRRIWDQAAAIRLRADDEPIARVMDLLPGGSDHEDFKTTVRAFIPSALRVEVLLTPKTDTLPAGRLSTLSSPRLGWNAWMGESGDTNERSTPVPARFAFECAGHEH